MDKNFWDEVKSSLEYLYNTIRLRCGEHTIDLQAVIYKKRLVILVLHHSNTKNSTVTQEERTKLFECEKSCSTFTKKNEDAYRARMKKFYYNTKADRAKLDKEVKAMKDISTFSYFSPVFASVATLKKQYEARGLILEIVRD